MDQFPVNKKIYSSPAPIDGHRSRRSTLIALIRNLINIIKICHKFNYYFGINLITYELSIIKV